MQPWPKSIAFCIVCNAICTFTLWNYLCTILQYCVRHCSVAGVALIDRNRCQEKMVAATCGCWIFHCCTVDWADGTFCTIALMEYNVRYCSQCRCQMLHCCIVDQSRCWMLHCFTVAVCCHLSDSASEGITHLLLATSSLDKCTFPTFLFKTFGI